MSNLVQYDPFAQLRSLQQQFFGDDFFAPLKAASIPTTDVYTKENELVVEAHLPNFHQDNIDIRVENSALIIQAERHEKDDDKDKKYVVRESSGSFYRRVQLPDRADSDKIEAHLDEGVLHVSIPLTPLPEPKKITIETNSKQKELASGK